MIRATVVMTMACLVSGFVVSNAAPLRAESVEIVTYYPSPATTTDDLKVKRTTVGAGYKTLDLDNPPVADGTLLVEGQVGIGTPTPLKTAPNNGKVPNGQPGNLDVNDIWLRSANAWASEALAGGLEPSKPYTVYLSVPSGGSATYDAYTALQLWKSGVTKGQVRITGSRLLGWNGPLLGGPSGGWTSNFSPSFWPPTLGIPTIVNGAVIISSNDGSAMVEVSVTW